MQLCHRVTQEQILKYAQSHSHIQHHQQVCTCVKVCVLVTCMYELIPASEREQTRGCSFFSLTEAKTEIKSYILDDDEYRMKTSGWWRGEPSKDLIFINKQSGVHRPEV